MGANLTIYCLEQVTDYAEFERLCHDLMSQVGFKSIEPLGGFQDKGRDAIHVSREGNITIFAYSVREDWRAKLAEDSGKIYKHNHKLTNLIFITTADISVGERDEAIQFINSRYGWKLDLYGLERLRNLLEVQFPFIKSLHPQIFPPDFLEIEERRKISGERGHILISYTSSDIALAEWLARKLTGEGYLVWCESLASLGEVPYPDDLLDAIQNRVFCVIALCSQSSLNNPDLNYLRSIAFAKSKQTPHFLIPLRVEHIPAEKLDQITRQLVFLPFETNWAEGLRLVLNRLVSMNCPKLLPNGLQIASEALNQENVLSKDSETLLTNYLEVEQLPDEILEFHSETPLDDASISALQTEWAFRKIDDRCFVSFQSPPLANRFELVSKISWRSKDRIHNISTKNLVSELLRKSLGVRCRQKGLLYCDDTHMYYFPFGLVPGDKIKYKLPDGKSAPLNTVGERKYFRGGKNEYYRYYLSPDFYVIQDLLASYAVLIRVRVRITDTQGIILKHRSANARRKDLCGDWWNKEWLTRMVAIIQYLADEGKISIGNKPSERIIVSAELFSLTVPVGIDEVALDKKAFDREIDVYEDEEEPVEEINS